MKNVVMTCDRGSNSQKLWRTFTAQAVSPGQPARSERCHTSPQTRGTNSGQPSTYVLQRSARPSMTRSTRLCIWVWDFLGTKTKPNILGTNTTPKMETTIIVPPMFFESPCSGRCKGETKGAPPVLGLPILRHTRLTVWGLF